MIRLVLLPFDQFSTFMESGGPVLWVIFAATALMWMFILERLWFFWRPLPDHIRETEHRWTTRADHSSWFAHRVRELWISQTREKAEATLSLIKTLVAVCPMLGLFGTVTGMIECFDVMAIAGNGNPRAMAAGVSTAIITTMAGMVAALSGLYFSVRLSRRANKAVQQLADHMTLA